MKNKIIVIAGLMGILLPLNAKALSGNVNLSCSSNSLTVNTSTTCTLSGYSDQEVSAISSKLNASGNISITDISTSNIWQGDGSGGSIELYTDSNKSGNFAIATFTIKASGTAGSGTINVSSTRFSDAGFEEHSISNKSLTITVKEVEKPKEDKPVVAPENNKPSNNTPNTNTNNNTNTQPTKPQQNTQQNNKVEEEKKSSDATLKTLTLSKGVIEFSSKTTDYKVEVSNEVESIVITAEATDSKSTVSIPENLNLNIGNNDFEIKVVAEDGTEKVYKLHITRLEKVLSNNSNLKTLEIEGHNLTFTTDNYVYDLKNIKSSKLNIKAVAEDENAKVEIIGNDSIGKNDSVIVKVVAEDGTTSEYIIYANNTEKGDTNISFIVVAVLFVISLISNIILIIKNKKNKDKENKEENKINEINPQEENLSAVNEDENKQNEIDDIFEQMK